MQKYFAELLGTFTLAFAVLISLGGGLAVPTPVLAALAVGLFVYTVGVVSGTHLNPAVTIGAFVIGKIRANDAIAYLIAQFLGAAIAAYAARFFVAAPIVLVSSTISILIAELIGTFLLTFGIASVMYGKTPPAAAGGVIGGSLLLGASLASVAGNGTINPAVAMAIGSLSGAYIAGPILGGILGMWAFGYLHGEELKFSIR